jgi:glycosyltransferase involved in cell wall biosynthesis
VLPDGAEYSPFTEPGVPTDIVGCWRFGAWNNALRLQSIVRSLRPDIALFNIQFASFAGSRAPAALGLFAPALIKRTTPTVTAVLLHNIMETVDLESAGFGGNSLLGRLTRFAGTVATRTILQADLVALTIPKYIDILTEKYGAENIFLAPHGAFYQVPQPPPAENGSQMQTILAFGKFGTYKRVEALLEAFEILQQQRETPMQLVIAGTDNPNAAGYLEEMQRKYAHIPNVTYTGYVEEDDVPALFQSADVVAFPYISTTGSSGVLHQAGSYGCAVVLPNLGDFAELIQDEGYVGEFFEPQQAESMAVALARLLDDPTLRQQQGEQNFLASQGIPIADVVDWYLLHFERLLAERETS